MSETFDLYNFDHRLPGQGTFVIGPYSISVDAAQSENLVHLPKRAQISLGFDQNLRRVVTRTEPTAGEILPTATVRRPAPPARSELFPDRKAISADYDLILLLSFVTGRRVYLERDLCSDPRRSYSDRIVSHVFFQHVPMQFWEDRTRLSEHTLSDALYCVVNAALAPELIGRGAYVNAALDALITSWAKRTGQTKFPNRSSLDTTIKKLVEWMDARLLVSVRNKLARHFKLEGVSPNISDDIRARLRQISAGPSAIMKMTAYLQANQLFPEQPTDAHTKRLKGLNTVRNAVAHSGTVYLDKELGVEGTDRVAAASVLVTQEIVEIGIAEALGIADPELTKLRQNVQRFFESGHFREQDVFTEDFDTLIARISDRWTEEGVME